MAEVFGAATGIPRQVFIQWECPGTHLLTKGKVSSRPLHGCFVQRRMQRPIGSLRVWSVSQTRIML